jgi:alcohol dehydrogenase (cytochrome c)
MYFPLKNTCALVTVLPNKPETTSLYGIRNKNQIAPGTHKIGTVQASNVETGRITWKHERRAGMMSLVTTGGGLIFGGDTNGHFLAFDQASGQVLWEINRGSPVTGYPISYAVGGRHYVAVSTGNSLVSSGLNTLAPELHPSNATNIFVFALPETI